MQKLVKEAHKISQLRETDFKYDTVQIVSRKLANVPNLKPMEARDEIRKCIRILQEYLNTTS